VPGQGVARRGGDADGVGAQHPGDGDLLVAMARYIAKYATTDAEASGTIDRPIRYPHELTDANLSPHARRMIWTCLGLAEFPTPT
jgi:hypothetical protein